MNSIITYVAMDTHKKQHAIAAIFPGSEQLLEMTVTSTAKELSRGGKEQSNQNPWKPYTQIIDYHVALRAQGQS